MQQKTFESQGLEYVSELTQQNFTDLYEILQWNLDHDIRFYRCTSNLVPWNSQFELSTLPDFAKIEALAQRCGELIKEAGMRFTFHPDCWCKLASDSPDTVERAVTAVEYHADWLDLMGLARTPITESMSTSERLMATRMRLPIGSVRRSNDSLRAHDSV